jgi:hypothetical protein
MKRLKIQRFNFAVAIVVVFSFVCAMPALSCTGFVSVGSTSDGGKTMVMKVGNSSNW